MVPPADIRGRAHQIHQQTIRGGTGRWRLEMLQRNLPGTKFWRLNSLFATAILPCSLPPADAGKSRGVWDPPLIPLQSPTRGGTQGDTKPAGLDSWKRYRFFLVVN